MLWAMCDELVKIAKGLSQLDRAKLMKHRQPAGTAAALAKANPLKEVEDYAPGSRGHEVALRKRIRNTDTSSEEGMKALKEYGEKHG